MTKAIMVDAAEEVVCPQCSHAFPLSEGISRQTIERYADEFERSLARRRKELEADLAAEAKRRAERDAAQSVAALKEQLAAAEARAKASHAQLDKAREEAKAAAKEQFETELRAAREALAAKESSLSNVRNAELELRRQLRELSETKNWQAAWVQKLKDDQQSIGAEIAVLVSSAMPKDAREPFVREADVWVTRLAAARPLAEALRIKDAQAAATLLHTINMGSKRIAIFSVPK
ncbi:MAG: hypothetical protein A3G27_13810 [Betaproteobacteria bacterium RIFCSPLOWO2_12_FULL_66_14]|nr:MAG: hypothetical protein A3G27_13810 [Betaproteobacteria bacterium RIFCSPLOWO2_12_FULL_66_14]